MIKSIPLNKLVQSPRNVRRHGDPAADAELKASIAARGLLQNLIVRSAAKGKFEVEAGERRRRAMLALADEKILARDHEVTCLVLENSAEAAVETSLAENFHRLAMNPADEAQAFAALVAGGATVEDVARRFGLTVRFVEGRLRLATLAPVVFEALASGQITLDIAKAFGATSDQDIQARVFEHLQETSAISALLNFSPLSLPQMAMDTVSVVQNEQIKAAISVVQSLQIANLAASGMGIGVSVAGAAILAKRIARVEEKVDAILPNLDAIVRRLEAMRVERIAEDFTRLRTLVDQVEEAWLPSATQREWIAIARDAHFLADSFERRARELSAASDVLNTEPLVEAFALASGLRVTARMASCQDDMAREAASSRALTLVQLGEAIQLAPLALAHAPMETAGTPEYLDLLEQKADGLRSTVARVREREIAAAATSETLHELARQGVSGREWLDTAKSEGHNPLLFLPVCDVNAREQTR